MKKKQLTCLDIVKGQYQSKKKIAKMNRWQKGWLTRRKRRIASITEIICTPNPLFADLRWVKS
jgi:hypothetical protein